MLPKVWEALGAGLCVKVAPLLTLAHVLRRYSGSVDLPPVLSSGVPCKRDRHTGLFVKSAQRKRASVSLRLSDAMLTNLNSSCLDALSLHVVGDMRTLPRLRVEWNSVSETHTGASSSTAGTGAQLRELLPSDTELIKVGQYPMRTTSSTSSDTMNRLGVSCPTNHFRACMCPQRASATRVRNSRPQLASTTRVHNSCPQLVSTTRVHNSCPYHMSTTTQHLSTTRVHNSCPQLVSSTQVCHCQTNMARRSSVASTHASERSPQ